MDARTQAWFDQYEARVAEVIRQHGWFIPYIGGGTCDRPGCDCPPDDGPAFAYTVGMFGLGHPELLVFSLPPEDTAYLINTLGRRILDGEAILPGHELTVEGFPRRLVAETVPNAGAIVFEANHFYRRPDEFSVPALQLTYDDAAGRFPWDDGYAGPPQPRPGTFAA